MINKKDQIAFIRNFLVCDGIDFFLGSGASLLAGIPSGQNLVWEFKKEIYCLKIMFQESYLKTCSQNETEENCKITLIL